MAILPRFENYYKLYSISKLKTRRISWQDGVLPQLPYPSEK